MQKPALFLMEEIYWTARLWKNRICVSKYRFLGSPQSSTKERSRSAKKGVLLIISENYGLHNYNKRYSRWRRLENVE
jgi:hypothetical protein